MWPGASISRGGSQMYFLTRHPQIMILSVEHPEMKERGETKEVCSAKKISRGQLVQAAERKTAQSIQGTYYRTAVDRALLSCLPPPSLTRMTTSEGVSVVGYIVDSMGWCVSRVLFMAIFTLFVSSYTRRAGGSPGCSRREGASYSNYR